MLGQRKAQRSLFSAGSQLGSKAVERMGLYGRLSQESSRLFRDADFSAAYCLDNGRPSAPPSLLVVAHLLQHYEGISDAQVIERCRYDLRWKTALDLDPLSVKAPFAKSTFQAFRVRLTLHRQEGLVFEKSVAAARDAGLLPQRLRVALDSSPVRGRGAVKDTYNLLSDAIVGVVRAVALSEETSAEQLASDAGLERHLQAPSIKGSELVEWSDSGAVSEFLRGLLADCDQVLALAQRCKVTTADVALLRKIIDQDIDRDDPTSPPRIRRGVARDRTPSVSDPEMRHGRKSSGKTYTGHKAHLAVELSSGIITAVETDAPGQADGSQVRSLVEQTVKVTQREVDVALGDSAYSSREAHRQACEAQIDLRTRMPSLSRGDRFTPEDFEVSQDGQTAVCPAGHGSARSYPGGPKNGPKGLYHRWSRSLCGLCALKSKCTSGKQRSLFVPPDFHERRRRERYARSPEGRQELRQRVVVEHAIARLKNLGAGAARCFGRAKTRSQWQWCAAVANLSLVWAQEATAGA